jgi:hypothetical protein
MLHASYSIDYKFSYISKFTIFIICLDLPVSSFNINANESSVVYIALLECTEAIGALDVPLTWAVVGFFFFKWGSPRPLLTWPLLDG